MTPWTWSTSSSSVLRYLSGFTQTHVHRVSDAIQPSHPLSPPSPPALNLSQIRVFSNEFGLHIRWPKYWSFRCSIIPSSEYSGFIPLVLMDLISLYHFKEAETRQHCISFCYLINLKTKQTFWLVNIRNYFVCNSFEYKSQDVTDFFLL